MKHLAGGSEIVPEEPLPTSSESDRLLSVTACYEMTSELRHVAELS